MSLKGTAETDRIVEGRVSMLKQIRGYSAYQVAVLNGFRGTEEEWLVSLEGIPTAIVEITDWEESTVNYTVEEILEFAGRGRRVVFRWYLGDSGNFRDYDLLGFTDGTALFQSKMNSSESEDFTVGMLAVYEGNHFYADQLVINQQAEVELVYDLDGECSLTTEKIYELSCMSKVVVFRDRGEAENEETTSYMLWHADASSAEFRSPVFISDDGELSVKIVRVTEPNIVSREEKVQEKPFYKITTLNGNALTWDGDTEGMTIVNNGDYNLYKISDATPSMEDIKNGGSVRVTLNKPDTGMSWVNTPAASVTSPADGVIDAGVVKIIHPEAVNVAIVSNDEVLNGLTFSEAGTYVMQSYVTRVEIPEYTGFTAAVKTLDPIYLPDSAVQTDPAQTPNEGDVLTHQDGTPKWAKPERTLDVSFAYDASGSLTCTPGADEVFAAHNARRTVAAVFENVRFPLDKAGDTVMDFAASGWLEGEYRMIRLFKDGNAFYYTGKTTGGGGASSWNDLTDRPVVMAGGDTLAWDGNTEGLEGVDLGMGDGTLSYHVSDVVPALSDFSAGGSIVVGDTTYSFNANDVQEPMSGFLMIPVANSSVVVVVPTDNNSDAGITFEKKGIYFPALGSAGHVSSLTIPGYTGFAQEKIAPSHLYQPDWEQTDEAAPDFVKNKPFGETVVMGDTLTWDGATGGLTSIAIPDGPTLYKVSDAVPSKDDFANGCTIFMYAPESSEPGYVAQLTPDNVKIYFYDDGCALFEQGATVIVPYDNYDVDGLVLPEKGVYFILAPDMYCGKFTIPGYTGFETKTIEPIDTKFLPEHLQFGVFSSGGDTLTWDGNTEGRATFAANTNMSFYKVSDVVPKFGELPATVNIKYEINSTPDVWDGMTVDQMYDGVVGGGSGWVWFVDQEGAGYTLSNGETIPEPGTYFMVNNGNTVVTSLTIPDFAGFPMTKTMDPQYLPGDLIPAYTAADEGKVLKIVNGVPTWVAMTDVSEVGA